MLAVMTVTAVTTPARRVDEKIGVRKPVHSCVIIMNFSRTYTPHFNTVFLPALREMVVTGRNGRNANLFNMLDGKLSRNIGRNRS